MQKSATINPWEIAHSQSVEIPKNYKEKRLLPPNFSVTHKPFLGGEVQKDVHYAEESLWLLPRSSCLRRYVVWLVTHPYFDPIILFFIILNAILMMLADYDKIVEDDEDSRFGLPDLEKSFWNDVNFRAEIPLTIIFTIELVLKVVAMGFMGEQGTYLQDPWNNLDFIVVVTAWIPLLLKVRMNFGIIRIFRVLRPLKSVNALPELQKIIISMFRAIPALLSVLVLLLFTYLVAGILGMQLFSGKMHTRCRLTPFPVTADWPGTPETVLDYACLSPDSNIKGKFDPTDISSVRSHNVDLIGDEYNHHYDTKSSSPWFGGKHKDCIWPVDEDNGYMCKMDDPNTFTQFSEQCYHGEVKEDWRWCGSDFDAFGNMRFHGDRGYVDLPYWDRSLYAAGEDLYWGFINFDSLPRSLLTIFQCITMEGWSDIMYMAMDAKGYVTAYIYFFLLMLLGSFFALNLLLAVLEENFHHEPPPPVISLRFHDGIYQRYMGTYVKEPKEGLPRKSADDEDRKIHGAVVYVKDDGDKKYYIYKSKVTGKWNMVDKEDDIFHNRSHFKSSRACTDPLSELSLPWYYSSSENHGEGRFIEDRNLQIHVEDEDTANAVLLKATHLDRYSGNVDELLKAFDTFRCIAEEATVLHATKFIAKELDAVFLSIMEKKDNNEKLDMLRKLHAKAINMDDTTLEQRCKIQIDILDEPPPVVKIELTPFEAWMKRGADMMDDQNSSFSITITLCIVINTIVLGLDTYPATPDYEYALEIINLVLSIIFTVEMFVKLFFLYENKFERYRKDVFNLFDATVVLLSYVEMVFPGGGGAFTVLRSFRLFRVFKLARKWKAMHRLLALIVSTLIDVSNFLLLVLLFIFIYSMIGVQFFANRMRFDSEGYSIPIGGESPRTHQLWSDTRREALGGVEIPRANFDTTLNAFVTVYQVLSGENWNTVMYDGMRATNDLAPWYFISLVVFGAMIVMNLFLAILLSNFGALNEEEDDDDDELFTFDEEDVWEKNEQDVIDEAGRVMRILDDEEPELKKRTAKRLASEMKPLSTKIQAAEKTLATALCDFLGYIGGFFSQISLRPTVIRRFVKERSDARLELLRVHEQAGTNPETDSLFPLSEGKTLFVFGPQNYIRQILALVVDHPVCDNLVTLLIIISTLFLIIDNPFLDPESNLKKFLNVMDMVMTTLFTMEMVSKMIAMGLWLPKESAYLRNAWNILDFVVVLVSIVSLTDLGAYFKWIRSVRTLRTLRPLRMISRNPALKLIVDVMIESAPGILRVTLVITLMFLILAIFCVSFFKGKLKSCQGDHFDEVIAVSEEYYNFMENPKAWSELTSAQKSLFGPDSPAYSDEVKSDSKWIENSLSWTEDDGPVCEIWRRPSRRVSEDSPEYYGLRKRQNVETHDVEWKFDFEKHDPTSRVICECWGGKWRNMAYQDFDNVLNSMLTLFEISTTEGWVDVMWAATDSRGIDMQPVRDIWINWTYFFMFFIFIGNYLFLNLFVGVTIDNFSDLKEKRSKEGASLFKTKSQKMWWDTYEMSIKMLPRPRAMQPADAIGQFFYKMTMVDPYAKIFDNFIMLCIILNTVIMAATFFGEPEWWTITCDVFNFTFMIIFNLEMICKLFAKRKMYFQNNGDLFDFFIVVLTDLGWILAITGSGAGMGPVASIIRTFRIGRALRLVNTDNQMARDIKRLGAVLLKTLPGVLNITCLLLLLFIIFSVIAVQLFAGVAYYEDHDEHTNFREFFKAFVVLFRFSTGENWNGFMHSIAGYGTKTSERSHTGETQKASECIEDMEFDANYCWYNPGWDCTPLNGCGNSAIIPYFVIFNMLIAFTFINLFVGVILEGFGEKDEHELVVEEDMEYFKHVWTQHEFDPSATCYLSIDSLFEFTRQLICGAPEGTSYNEIRLDENFPMLKNKKKVVSEQRLNALLSKINTGRTPIKYFEGDKVYFKNVLMAFESYYVTLKLGKMEIPDDLHELDPGGKLGSGVAEKIKMLHDQQAHNMGGMSSDALTHNDFNITLREYLAARVLFRAIKKVIMLKKLQKRKQAPGGGGPGSAVMTREEWAATMGSTRRIVDTNDAECQTETQSNALAVMDKVERLGGRQLPFLPQIGSSPISPMGLSMGIGSQTSPVHPIVSPSRRASPQIGPLSDEDDSLL